MLSRWNSQLSFLPLALILHAERKPVSLYRLALKSASVFLFLAASIGIANALIPYNRDGQSRSASIALQAIQFAAAVVGLLLSLSLPRRPSVFLQNQPVDEQYTVSYLSRYSFSWTNSLLSVAKTKKGLDLEDLPFLHLGVRSAYLHEQLNMMQKKNRVWKIMLSAYYLEALFQTGLSTLLAFLTFAPTVAMYKFLQLLEERSAGEVVNSQAWAWIVGLGSSLLAMNLIETWLFWIVCE